MKKQSGITLIALVITIIVLLILAGVSINMITGEDGIIEKASNASEKTKEESKKEQEKLGEVPNYIDSQVNRTETPDDNNTNISTTLPSGWDNTQVSGILTEDDKTVPIPINTTVSQVEGENTIAGGLVVYEGTEAVTEENHETALTTRNQYVWIPVDDVNEMFACSSCKGSSTLNSSLECSVCGSTTVIGKLYYYGGSYTNVSNNEFLTANKSYFDPDILDSDRVWEASTANFQDMAQSVATYKGYYISRYEVNASGKSVKGQTMASVGVNETTRASFLNSLTSTYTNMAFGCQYDKMILFMGDEALESHSNRNLGSISTTGANELDVIKNIYDFEGNAVEITAGEKTGAGGFFLSANGIMSVAGSSTPLEVAEAASTRMYLPFDVTVACATRSCLILK